MRNRQAIGATASPVPKRPSRTRLTQPALVVAAVAIGLLVSGCGRQDTAKEIAASPIAAPPAGLRQDATIPFGPGPSGTYTVQAQPAAGSCHYGKTADGQPLPDPVCTPGALNPKVTPATLAETICKSGYTGSIRPPGNITDREKKASMVAYGYTGNPSVSEYDHLISLELGGDPNDPRNLWVEPPSPGHTDSQGVSNPKDGVETQLKTLVCKGKVALADAQYAIATDWTTALVKVGHPNGN